MGYGLLFNLQKKSVMNRLNVSFLELGMALYGNKKNRNKISVFFLFGNVLAQFEGFVLWIISHVLQLFFNTQQLVVFCHTV